MATQTFDEKLRKTLMVQDYYNNDTEMPHIPDVGILHCGELPHHRMGIKLNTFKNVEGGTVGRILSYYDLCDIPQQAGNSTVDKDLDFSEFMTEEESEEVELRRQQREEEELRKREEEEWLLAEEERKAKEEEEETRRRRSIRIMEEKRRAEKEAKEPRETADIFKEINQKRKHSVRPKSAHTNNSRVIYARRGSDDITNLGGTRITFEEACILKSICFGSPMAMPETDWLRTGIVFHNPGDLHAFGLKTQKGPSKPFQMVLQACILKYLMFHKFCKRGTEKNSFESKGFSKYKLEEETMKNVREPGWELALLRPSGDIQREAVCLAIIELLWRCGGKSHATLCISGTNNCFDGKSTLFKSDGISEKLHLFTCQKVEELDFHVRKNLSHLLQDKGGGLLQLLYSIVLSKGVDELKRDMQDRHQETLVTTDEQISHCLSNLMLTGVATPYCHNGVISADYETHHDFGEGKVGIVSRNEFGFLYWNSDNKKMEAINLGSRYRTPILPIWVTVIQDSWGVLFNPNKDLMKSYAAENRFLLYYYSNTLTKATLETKLVIDTRGATKAPAMDEDMDEEESVDPMGMAIQTKWAGASVTWKNVKPYL